MTTIQSKTRAAISTEGNIEGAAETIKKFKPTLAICAYHKAEDLITLPQFIKSLNPNYKLYLRKHTLASDSELVLYAIP